MKLCKHYTKKPVNIFFIQQIFFLFNTGKPRQLTLHWVRNDDRPLKQWARNRVSEIRRFTSPDNWYYVDARNKNCRHCDSERCYVKIHHLTWINAYDWIKKDVASFPIKSRMNAKLTKADFVNDAKESNIQQSDASLPHDVTGTSSFKSENAVYLSDVIDNSKAYISSKMRRNEISKKQQ